MDNSENNVKTAKKPHTLRDALKILTCVFGGIFVGIVACSLVYYLLFGFYFGGYIMDGRLSTAESCKWAINASIVDYYEAEKKEIPADKEYTVNVVFGRDGLVNEPNEFFPGSINHNYYSEGTGNPCYIIMKYKDGKFSEMWMSEKKLSDEELIPYSRYEMQEQYGPIKRFRDVIVYIGYRSEFILFH